jgi:hypothetical protein
MPVRRLPALRSTERTSAARAITPPSPSLSARRMKITYLTETTIVIDQNTSDTTPNTSPRVARTIPLSRENTVCMA